MGRPKKGQVEVPDAAPAEAKPKRQPRRTRSASTTIRSTPEWREWLAGFSAHVRKDATDAIDEALARYARSEGYQQPPKR